MTSASQRPEITPKPAIPETDSLETAKPSQIRPEALVEVRNRIQAREFDQAKTLLAKLESGFPGNGELKSLSERLRVEEVKQQRLAISFVQKAESALIAGRYVTPHDDNVLVYCNKALGEDPRNPRALSLKREVVERAVTQAKDWIQREKFDAARLYYASLDYLAANDNQFPLTRAELNKELEKLEFKSYSVSHEHGLGRCTGKLRINAYAVSYVPSGNSADGFTESLRAIVPGEDGERLKISFRDRTVRFHPNLGSKKENLEIVKTIYGQLLSQMRVASR
jgi:hypothetical protein